MKYTWNVYLWKDMQPIGKFQATERDADREFDIWRWQHGDLDKADVEFEKEQI